MHPVDFWVFGRPVNCFRLGLCWAALASGLVGMPRVWAEDKPIEKIEERDIPLKSLKLLRIAAGGGRVEIQPWNMDRVRISVRKWGGESSAALLDQIEVKSREVDGRLEISTLFGKGLESFEQMKVQRRAQKKAPVRVDFVIKAPPQVRLEIHGGEAGVAVRGWTAPVEVHGSGDEVTIEDCKGEVSVSCSVCSILARHLTSGARLVSQSGDLRAETLRGRSLHLESRSGEIRGRDLKVKEQFYLSEKGLIDADDVQGQVGFDTDSAPVRIANLQGHLSGHSVSGRLQLHVSDWNSREESLIETVTGDIRLSLPPQTQAEVLFTSVQGKLESEWELRPLSRSRPVYGPPARNRLEGELGGGGELLTVWSKKGTVQVLRGL